MVREDQAFTRIALTENQKSVETERSEETFVLLTVEQLFIP